jgi:hypothetical protein
MNGPLFLPSTHREGVRSSRPLASDWLCHLHFSSLPRVILPNPTFSGASRNSPYFSQSLITTFSSLLGASPICPQ